MKNTQEDTICAVAYDLKVKVVIENLNEGLRGDYNPTDPEDINLLRFTVFRSEVAGWVDVWIQVEDASYCTQLSADTEPEILKRAANYLAEQFGNVLNADPYQSVKKLGESLSWISADMFEDLRPPISDAAGQLSPESNKKRNLKRRSK